MEPIKWKTLKQKVLKDLYPDEGGSYIITPGRVKQIVEETLDHLLNSLPGEQQMPKTKCMNAENHMFGRCFECEKARGYNSCRQEIITLITNAKK